MQVRKGEGWTKGIKVREKGRDKNKNKYGERMSRLRNKDAKNKKLIRS